MKVKNSLYKFMICGVLLNLIPGCDTDRNYSDLDKDGQHLYEQNVILFKELAKNNKKQAAFHDISAIAMKKEAVGGSKYNFFFSASLVKSNEKNVNVTLMSDKEAIEQYNRQYGTSYEALPDSLLKYTERLTIAQGELHSESGFVEATYSPLLDPEQKYIAAISIQSVDQGVNIFNASKTMFFAFEIESDKIMKSALLTRNTYFRISKNNSMIANLTNTFTMEGLINVSKFRSSADVGDAQISTFMGTEGATLMRFGDAGVPGNHLQANGTDIGMTFETGKWYHIALVVSSGQSTVYVNGEEIKSFSKSGYLSEFYIGRSYNGNRGIEAKVSEIRLWSTARSAEEINANMYKATDMNGIFAYWKMNSATDNKITDESGNGNDLELYGQKDETGRQSIRLVDEEGILVK